MGINDEYRQLVTVNKKFNPNEDLIITEFKPVVDTDDIDNGFIFRYFIARTTEARDVTEVDKNTYDKIVDNPLYIGVTLKWIIVPPSNKSTAIPSALDANSKAIQLASEIIPNIVHKLKDKLEYNQG